MLLVGLGSAALWTGLGIAMTRTVRLEGSRLFWLDQLFSARQRLGASPAPHPDVIIIGIDERTRAALRDRAGRNVDDRWIIRHAIGRLLAALSKADAKAVGVDFLLDRPVADDVDELVVDGLVGSERTGVPGVDAVLGSFLTLAEEKRPIETFLGLADEGNVMLQPDSDGKFRRVRPGVVSVRPAVIDRGDIQIPIFAFQVCRLFVGGRDNEYGSARATPWTWHEDGSLEVDGHFHVPAEMLIDFAGPAQWFESRGRQFSAIDVLDGAVPPEKFKGKLVLIGPALRNRDRFSVSVTPQGGDRRYREFFERKYGVQIGRLRDRGVKVDLLRNEAMSGVEIQANLAAQILDGRSLREAAREMPWAGPAVIAAVLLGLGWAFWGDPGRGKRRVRRGMVGSAVLFLVVFAGAIAMSVSLFVTYRWVFIPLELLAAWTGQAACGIAVTGVQVRRQSRRIEQMFGSAVGEELLDYIHAHPEIMTGSRRRVATVLFCDIRGFTPLTEQLGSGDVVDLLRGHFEALWHPLSEQGAWVDKYVGDLVMAAWNVLQPAEDHALRGVRAAVGMKVARAELNRRRARQNLPTVEIGIGLHTGEVVGGNIGSRKRSNFTLIGDTVNLASRIEGEAGNGEVLLSEDTYRLVREHVIARPLPPVPIKGKTGLYTLYEVYGLVGGPAVPGREQQAAQAAEQDIDAK